ncbi:3-beta hydroxysteroid dehydrogenase [Sorangium cellulosum]|uniref:3-beta hydroxysteroid dehydrogenase n=1 Tax=Sorangium cellulosum TaxID=56 RepID=A0A4V0NE48_SORCE|nr:SDR family oxidoreductase [Sorangium cellulosum]AUX24922.1 3-beta hydroxysteroid dehydrogenase [Sorangium cellulosum]
MRVFVTGATGFIGSAVVAELLRAGHHVVGLARSDASAAALARQGAEAFGGDLNDAAALAAGVRSSDGVIHLAHDWAAGDLAESMVSDRRAIDAIGSALEGTNKPFVGTSGVMVLAPGRIGAEDDAGDPASAASFRVPSENAVLAFAQRGVRACVVRPSPSVHGAGDTRGFVAMFVQAARQHGKSAYIGAGDNRWSAVHRLDAARLFRLALEKGTSGTRYHAVGDEGIPFREIAEKIGRGLGVPTVSLPPEQAGAHFGPFAPFTAIDNPASNALTRARLAWEPQSPGLLEDLETGIYTS